MLRLPCSALVLLVAAAPVVRAQEPRLMQRLAPGPRIAVQQLIDSATARGLPGEPLLQKALEGASKGADSARIVGAVRSLATLLAGARQSLGSRAGTAELVAGAAALRAGASPDKLHQLAALRSTEQLTVPLSVLADLLASGVPLAQAWDGVYRMTSQGANDAALLALRDRMTTPRRATATPQPAEQPPMAPLPGTERPR